MPGGWGFLPRQRTAEDVDADLARKCWVRDQAIDRLDGGTALFATRDIDQLLEERFALQATQ